MRTSEATRYARYAALAAGLLAVIVAGVFFYRSWQAREARRKAPPAVPPTVQQRSAEFSFSKVEQDRTLFTVRASRATEFKEGSRNLLEDVWITIFGRAGQRFDNIHTQACEYLSDTGRIFCAGEVQFDLESAEDASRRRGKPAADASARIIHVATSKVSFDRETGEARTDQPVVFRFPYGEGRGVGVLYSSRNAVVRLLRNVELTLTRSTPSASVVLTGGSMEYRREDHTLRLLAPVRVRQGPRELMAGELALELDANLRAQRLVASAGRAGGARPELRSAEPRGQAVLAADQFVALFHPQGWVERVLANGSVRGEMKGHGKEDRLEAQQLDLEMVSRQNEARTLTASGNVVAETKLSAGAGSRRLETAALRLFFAPVAKPGERRLERAETLAPATLELHGTSVSGEKKESQDIRVRGQQMVAEFGERNRMKRLVAHNAVEVERRLAGRPPQVTSSRELAAQFGPGGEWTTVEQTGDVRLREADRTAQAERARLERASDIITLMGAAVVSDPTTRTTAQSVSFNQRTSEISAQGEVRSTDISGDRSAVNLAPQPAHISADRLAANSSSGRAVYSGRARLWQGDAVVEADSIELLRDARVLNARGNVIAVFPEAAGRARGPAAGSPAGAPGKSSAEPDVWRVRAGALTYWSAEGRARLEEKVRAESRHVAVSSRALELFFSSSGPSAGPAAAGAGAQQLTRAVATGGVTVRQGQRRGTAERGDYFAPERKFVLSGGSPTLYDASRGTTTGRQLTFFFADDRIVVDSEEGSRTLTRHRVEK